MRVIACPNPTFSGRRFGIEFREGRALVPPDLMFGGMRVVDLMVRWLGYEDITDQVRSED